jgi:hypothetical protein
MQPNGKGARMMMPFQMTSQTRPEGVVGRKRTRLYVEDRRRPRTKYGEVVGAALARWLQVGKKLRLRLHHFLNEP